MDDPRLPLARARYDRLVSNMLIVPVKLVRDRYRAPSRVSDPRRTASALELLSPEPPWPREYSTTNSRASQGSCQCYIFSLARARCADARFRLGGVPEPMTTVVPFRYPGPAVHTSARATNLLQVRGRRRNFAAAATTADPSALSPQSGRLLRRPRERRGCHDVVKSQLSRARNRGGSETATPQATCTDGAR